MQLLPSNEILIDNVPYKIELQDGEVMSPNIGVKLGDTKKILMSRDQGEADLVDTFWHEVLHAIIAARGRASGLRLKDEETVVSVLAPGLVQVIRDNSDWMHWAMGLGASYCRRHSPPKDESTIPKHSQAKEATHGNTD